MRYTPEPGMRALVPSTRRKPPVQITYPGVGMPTSQARPRCFIAYGNISALLKLVSACITTVGLPHVWPGASCACSSRGT